MTSPSQTNQRPADLEAGSFRDPESRVFYADGAVYRALSKDGLEDFDALAGSTLYERAIADGRLVGTERIDDASSLPAPLVKERAGALKHERIPFVSYPYEWPFSMLKDAALLQLDLLAEALAEDLVLKDSSPYNVQFRGGKAVFVDVGSFEQRRPEPWVGYRQFCELFLYPLMLQGWKGVRYHPWLRGSIDGIEPTEMRGLMSFRDRFRRGTFTHVFLHARLEQRYADREREDRSEAKPGAGSKKEVILASVRKLRKLVERIGWEPPEGVWTAYGERNSYTDDDTKRKEEFVRAVAGGERWGLTWDIGANNGRYSRIAAEGSDYVVAVDADQGPVELLYRTLRDEGNHKILPLTMNLADPSPNLGWRGLERKSLPDRGAPDLVLALALIHHMTISANIPVREFLGWLAGLGCSLVIEFPTREDPMVKRLLSGKRQEEHPDYELGYFERALADVFDVERSERLGSGTRVLYFARPKGSGSPIDL